MRINCATVLALTLFACIAVWGCAGLEKPVIVVGEEEESLSHDAELKTWREALDDFRNEDYHKAQAGFEYLSEHAKSPELCRKATYALASTRLALAQTPGEFNDAMLLWECWEQQIPDPMEGEDPRMITPFLDRLTTPGLPEPAPKKESKPRKKIDNRLELVSKDLAIYKNLLDAKDKEFQRVKTRLESREREVRRLRQQIESLEAIHLKYQEKKKEAQ